MEPRPQHPFSPSVFAAAAFAPYTDFAARLSGLDRWPSVEELDACFRDRLELPEPVALERQGRRRQRGRGSVYEVRIHAGRRIPTRPGSWHDLMNVLVWCAFPRAKRALTARQHAIVEGRVAADATRLPSARTREQDALAMLDEGGVLLAHPPGAVLSLDDPEAIEAALREGRATLRIFGHALLEAIVEGQLRERDLRGAVVRLVLDEHAALERVDAALAAHVADPTQLLVPDPARSLWLRRYLGA